MRVLWREGTTKGVYDYDSHFTVTVVDTWDTSHGQSTQTRLLLLLNNNNQPTSFATEGIRSAINSGSSGHTRNGGTGAGGGC